MDPLSREFTITYGAPVQLAAGDRGGRARRDGLAAPDPGRGPDLLASVEITTTWTKRVQAGDEELRRAGVSIAFRQDGRWRNLTIVGMRMRMEGGWAICVITFVRISSGEVRGNGRRLR